MILNGYKWLFFFKIVIQIFERKRHLRCWEMVSWIPFECRGKVLLFAFTDLNQQLYILYYLHIWMITMDAWVSWMHLAFSTTYTYLINMGTLRPGFAARSAVIFMTKQNLPLCHGTQFILGQIILFKCVYWFADSFHYLQLQL